MQFISIIMANFRAVQHLSAAIDSVLRQTHDRLELIISDDASGDGSLDVIRAAMERDPRIILIEAATNGGAAAARNRALEAATGDWIAIMDSDDVIHPDRLRRMLAAAGQSRAQIVSDDLVFFGETEAASGRTLLQALDLDGPQDLDAARLMASEGADPTLPKFGYLKPLIARAALGEMRYDTSLSIAEDLDLYLRLLMARHRWVMLPDPMYLYRRHSASLSYRLSAAAIAAMIAAQERLALADAPHALQEAGRARTAHLRHQERYLHLVDAIKARKMSRAAGHLLRAPGLLGDLTWSVRDRLARRGESDGARSAQTLSLGGQAKPGEGLSLSPPSPPEPAGTWSEPPHRMAAQLSALAARHDLSVKVTDSTALWAAWLLPRYAQMRFDFDTGEDADGLPLPAQTAQ